MRTHDAEHCVVCGMMVGDTPAIRQVRGHEVRFDSEECANLYVAAAKQGVLADALDAEEHPHVADAIRRMVQRHKTAFFDLDGMWCSACAAVSSRVLERAPGVLHAEISFAAGKGRVDYDPEDVTLDSLMQRLENLGYKPRLSTHVDDEESDRAEESLLIQVIVAAVFMMQVMLLYLTRLYGLYSMGDFSSAEVRNVQYLAWLLATPALFIGGRSFLRMAYHSALARTANMDTLVALGTLAAYAYSAYAAVVGGLETYFDSVVMITAFIMFGRYLEAMGGSRARKDVRALLALQPDRAWRIEGGELVEVRAVQIRAGDRIAIKPGERVPVDAEVQAGEASLDESMLTGESAAVRKSLGDEVLAGTVLLDGSLEATVLRTGEDTRLAQIRDLVRRTLASQPPVQRLADAASAWLTYGVIAASALTLVTWGLLGAGWPTALIHAVAVLVVACPCALGLATPLAISVSLGAATRGGVIVRNAAALERTSLVDLVAFDKTGTLTRGGLHVADVGAIGGADQHEVVCLAASAERWSEHPLGRAILATCPGAPQSSGFAAHRGEGVEAVSEGGDVVRVGRPSFMPVPPPDDLTGSAEALEEEGSTVIWVAKGDRVVGYLALADELAEGAASAVVELANRGATTALLSGDSETTTAAIARRLGIAEHRSRISPAEKAEFVRSRQAAGANVLMAGDGVNDAPALAQADISVTVAGGTDVASETSDIVLAHADLRLLPWFVGLSALTRRLTRQNLGWALAYNAVTLPLAAFGVISPAIAAATMATSSLLVVGNSLRLDHLLRRPGSRGATASGVAAVGAAGLAKTR